MTDNTLAGLRHYRSVLQQQSIEHSKSQQRWGEALGPKCTQNSKRHSHAQNSQQHPNGAPPFQLPPTQGTAKEQNASRQSSGSASLHGPHVRAYHAVQQQTDEGMTCATKTFSTPHLHGMQYDSSVLQELQQQPTPCLQQHEPRHMQGITPGRMPLHDVDNCYHPADMQSPHPCGTDSWVTPSPAQQQQQTPQHQQSHPLHQSLATQHHWIQPPAPRPGPAPGQAARTQAASAAVAVRSDVNMAAGGSRGNAAITRAVSAVHDTDDTDELDDDILAAAADLESNWQQLQHIQQQKAEPATVAGAANGIIKKPGKPPFAPKGSMDTAVTAARSAGLTSTGGCCTGQPTTAAVLQAQQQPAGGNPQQQLAERQVAGRQSQGNVWQATAQQHWQQRQQRLTVAGQAQEATSVGQKRSYWHWQQQEQAPAYEILDQKRVHVSCPHQEQSHKQQHSHSKLLQQHGVSREGVQQPLQVAGSAADSTSGPAASRYDSVTNSRFSKISARQSLHHHNPQQAKQQAEGHAPADVNIIRERCARLLHRLSLSVSGAEDNDPLQPAQAGGGAAAGRGTEVSTAAAAAGGHTAATVAQGGRGASSSNKRWPWLGAERRDAEGRAPGSHGYDPSTLHIPPAALVAMSEFPRQFWLMKARCMDLVLFVRHGSFYNLFDVDADVGLRVGLNLSGQPAANMWKVGCHKDYFAQWCAKVLAQGYSVGRVEEMPTTGRGASKGVLERRLVRIYSPGTAVEGLLAEDLDHRAHPIMCLAELPSNSSGTAAQQPSPQHWAGRGSSSTGTSSGAAGGTAATVIGVCVLDVASGQCQIGSFSTAVDPSRAALAAALLMHDPVECIAVRNNLTGATTTLVTRHCEMKGSSAGGPWAQYGSSSGCVGSGSAAAAVGKHVPGLSWLPVRDTAAVLNTPMQMLTQVLPAATLQQLETTIATSAVGGANSRECGGSNTAGAASAAAAAALAVAVAQLKRCSLADEVLLTMQLGPLDGLARQATQSSGGPMLLDDKAILTLDLLTPSSGSGGSRGPDSLLQLLDRAASPAGRRTLRHWLCRPLTVASAINERLDVVDLFMQHSEPTALLQYTLADQPDADRLLPKAAAALRTLQQQQQQAQQCEEQQQVQHRDMWPSAGGSDISPMFDLNDTCAVEAQKAAWKALAAVPACLMGLVQAVALLRRQLKNQGVDTEKLPLLHKAVLAAARASRPVQVICKVLEGATWAGSAAADSNTASAAAASKSSRQKATTHAAGKTSSSASTSSSRISCIRLAPGADAAYDEAWTQQQQVEAEYNQAVAETLAWYSSQQHNTANAWARTEHSTANLERHSTAGKATVRHVFVHEQEQGLICLVVQPPAAVGVAQGSASVADGRRSAFGKVNNANQQYGWQGSAPAQFRPASLGGSELLQPDHVLVQQEHLSNSDAATAAAVGRAGATTVKGSNSCRATRGRGNSSNKGRGRGRAAAAASAAVNPAEDELMVLHVQVPDLLELGQQLAQAQQQVAAAAAAALDRVANTFLSSYSQFSALIHATAELDILAGFAQLAQPGNAPHGCCFCRPRFTAADASGHVAAAEAASATEFARQGSAAIAESPVLQLQGLWHPLMGAAADGSTSAGGSVMPNDMQLGGDKPGAMILTGANMGGKSTLLRATCLAVIMAQLGCYVPATAALLSPVDAIYTRIGAADAIMCGLSTFMVEMSETAACLAAATPNSLIVLDELGRGTSTHDGYAIAYAVLRSLACPETSPHQQHLQHKHLENEQATSIKCSHMSSLKPRVLFATHYHNLNCEPELQGKVQCCHMATELDAVRGHLVHLYKLRPGPAPAGSCGIEVAALAGLPSNVVHRAGAVAAAMEKHCQIGRGGGITGWLRQVHRRQQS